MSCLGATRQELGTPGSPSWKAALIWSFIGSSFQAYVTVSKSHLENRTMQPSS